MEIIFVIAAFVTIVTGAIYICEYFRKYYRNHNKK